MYTPILLLASALLASAGVQQKDFSGIGRVFVLQSDDWRTATPKSTVGCLSDQGKFINNNYGRCGVFSRRSDYPYTLTSRVGNCTFLDKAQEKNTDSHYGSNDHAWSCVRKHQAELNDQLYTIDGFPYLFLCFGDVACYYDAKKLPQGNDALPLWQYRWGSEQLGITPGHVQLQLMWDKIGDLPKREGEDEHAVPGPRLRIQDRMEAPLQGSMASDAE